MNRRKVFAGLILGFIIILVTLAGCQELGDTLPFLKSPTRSSVSPTSVDLQSTLFPEKTPSPTAEEPSTFVLWMPPRFDPESGTAAGEILRAQLEQYSTDHPGETIQTRIKAETGMGGLLDTLMTASGAAPAALPNLVLLSRPDFEKAAKAGLLAPLGMAELPADQTEWFPFSLQLASVNSSIYGVPFAGDMLVMGYKKSVIAYPPVDWEGIYKQGAPLTFPAADPLGITTALFYMNAGGSFLLEDEKVILDEKPLQDGLQIFYNGASAGIFQFWMLDQKSFPESNQIFLDTASPYELTWSSLFLNNRNENLAITPIPGITGEGTSLVSGWVLAIPQSSNEKMSESLEFMNYLIDPAFQSDWSEAAGYIPVHSKALEEWSDREESGILMKIAISAQVLPDIEILEKVGPLFSEATQDLIKQQVSYIQAANSILTRLSE